ncbi:MAG: exodeoxyribonuclease [Pseudomonadota bacterium]|jgi:exodeoxyribonuclease-3
MKVISANLNGIRSAQQKGFFEWVMTVNPDIICLQEIKADLSVIPDELRNFADYYSYFCPAQKKGYSGVAIFTKVKPDHIIYGLDNTEIDNEGRYLEIQYANLSIVSLYLPSGSTSDAHQQKKMRFLDYYLPILRAQISSEREYILCGDWNIAHQEIDLKNWRGNLKNSGFLPEERSWLSQIFALGYTDSWRYLYPQQAGYTWWSNRGQAYANDVGWRIDYQIISNSLVEKLVSGSIYKQQKFSDHAPLLIEYTLNLV